MIPDILSPNRVINAHVPLLVRIFEAFEASVPKARAYFPDKPLKRANAISDPVNSSLFSSIVRYEVSEELDREGITADDDDDNTFSQQESYDLAILPNNGLVIRDGDAQFRIRKANHGRIPNPATLAQKDFYQQTLFADHRVANFLILWHIDQQYRFMGLDLGFPRCGDGRHGAWQWKQSLPHPAILISRSRIEAADELLSDELPIHIRRSEQKVVGVVSKRPKE